MAAQELRRLLELAAKAANAAGGRIQVIQGEQFEAYDNGRADGIASPEWNPSEDDGDSRRLQVALELELRVFNGKAHAGKQDQFWITEDWFPDGDPNAASRLAVLRAAAAIWEKMGAKP